MLWCTSLHASSFANKLIIFKMLTDLLHIHIILQTNFFVNYFLIKHLPWNFSTKDPGWSVQFPSAPQTLESSEELVISITHQSLQ